MKKPASQERSNQAQTINQQSLHRTQIPSNHQTEINARPSSAKKIQSNKNIASYNNPQRINKRQYIVQDNMTQSRIHQAKNGLQLLKKKLSSKGMSRQKLQTNVQMQNQMQKVQQESRYTKPSSNLTKTSSNPGNSNKNIPPKSTMPSNKRIPDKKQQQFEQKPYKNDYVNEMQQIAIKPKGDFLAILEREMKKENQMQNNQQSYSNPNKYDKDEPQNEEDIELAQCGQGCGRMFNVKVLPKHQKICVKVFQSKRKAFDSAQHRQPQIQGNIPKLQPMKNQKKSTTQKNIAESKSKVPKWKQQSLQFRAGLKAVQGEQLSKEEKKVLEQQDGRVACNYCGRRFGQKAAERHIPFCQAKSKQIPKMNTTISKKK